MVLALAFALAIGRPGLVIQHGLIYDGLGGAGRMADMRIEGDTIRDIGEINPREGDKVIDARGLAVSPGFIDAHSHASGGILDDPLAETQIRQGITTAVVGEDGSSEMPLSRFFADLRRTPPTINIASFVGHGTVRSAVMGDAARRPNPEEAAKMAALVELDMTSGALGLSSGLEYQPGRYSDTKEVAELAKIAGKHGGMYISHIRNEDNHAVEAIQELINIASQAKLPVQINHIKLGSARVWGRARDVLNMIEDARKSGLQVSADVYPYLYWQSTIRVLIATEEWQDRAQWSQGISDVGGAENILLTRYSPDPSWEGKTIADIAALTGRDPVTVVQEIVEKCHAKGRKESESVVVTAMSEADLCTFMASPHVMFCSDGGLHGTHPRGAGSFPRILGVYVREKKVLSLPEAIRKMTSLPASRFGFKDRGVLKPGMKADIVLFDPKTVLDQATTKEPEAKPIGIPTVIVNGEVVLMGGSPTPARPGRPLRRAK